jgi:hypothetical protein
VAHLVVLTALTFALADAPPAPGPAASDDFGEEARVLFRAAACGTPTAEVTLPRTIPAALVDRHCQGLRALLADWRRRWISKAVPFLEKVVPADLPGEVVYPFGGGDLFTALATFPRASVITTLSLEPAGNPVAFAAAGPEPIEHALVAFRDYVRRLSFATHSKTTNLLGFRTEVLPDQLAFALLALSAFDFEPVSLRFMQIEKDGQLRYQTRDELLAARPRRFAHMELTFRRRGEPSAPLRTYRHLQANLADRPLGGTPGVIAHLEAKGRVAAMTKAASYLLWSPAFTRIRDYLLGHADWMISDSTGIPPRFAQAAGFEQETWGRFTGSFLKVARQHEADFVRLWAEHPDRALPFGFGYPDKDENDHLLVTRRRASAP